MSRREFSRAVKVEIIRRATRTIGDDGLSGTFCEECGSLVRAWEIHHLREDALEVDKSKPLTAEEGALWCKPCHREYTSTHSVPVVAAAKRQEAAHLGAEKPNKAEIPQRPKPAKSTAKLDALRALGPPALARQGFVSLGSVGSRIVTKINPKKAAE
jgi:uncharacterized protein YbaR (Trm112 family)